MSPFHSAQVVLRRLGRLILVAVLMGTSSTSATLGEALVLHRHGRGGVHLHVVTHSGVESVAPFSVGIGQSPWRGPNSVTPLESVHVYAVVANGSLFLIETDASDSARNDANTPFDWIHGPDSAVELPAVHYCPKFSSLSPTGQTGGAEILNRNHVLLL